MLGGCNRKERLQKKGSSKVSEFFWRRKKQQYACERYRNLPEDEKRKKLAQYRKNWSIIQKTKIGWE